MDAGVRNATKIFGSWSSNNTRADLADCSNSSCILPLNVEKVTAATDIVLTPPLSSVGAALIVTARISGISGLTPN